MAQAAIRSDWDFIHFELVHLSYGLYRDDWARSSRWQFGNADVGLNPEPLAENRQNHSGCTFLYCFLLDWSNRDYLFVFHDGDITSFYLLVTAQIVAALNIFT